MKNLFDGIIKVQRKELISQIANLESYKISIYFTLIFKNFYTIIAKYLNKFLFDLNIKKSYHPEKFITESIDNYFYKRYRICESCTDNEINNILRHEIKIRVIFLSGNIFKSMPSDDSLSVYATKVAATILKKSETRGKSIMEKNELIFQKYPNINKPSNKKILQIWLICFLSIILFFFSSFIFMEISIKKSLIFMVICQIIILYVMEFLQIKWQMAHFVWLAVSGGGLPIDINKMPVHLLQQSRKEKLIKNMQAIHTLLCALDVANNEKRHIEDEKLIIQSQYDDNQLKIAELQENINNDQVEELRVIKDKYYENKQLDLKIRKFDDIIVIKNNIINDLEKLLNPLMEITKNIIVELWSKYFPRIYFLENVIQLIISQFSFYDLETIEKRFYEIHNSSVPSMIAKKKGIINTITFLTNQGDIAHIDFNIDEENDKIIICLLRRSGCLNEPFITNDELKSIIKANNMNSDSNDKLTQLINWYKQQKIDWENQENKLNEEVYKLNKDKYNLLFQLTDKEVLVNDLQVKLHNKDNECQKLKERLDKLINSDANSSEIETLTIKLKKTQHEKDALRKIYDKVSEDFNYITKKYIELEKHEKELIDKVKLKDKIIEDYSIKMLDLENIVTNTTEFINECNKNLEQKESQINVIATLIERSEKSSNVNSETLKKLYKNIEKIKDDYKNVQIKQKESKKYLETIKKEKDKIKKEIENYKKNNKQLEEKIKEKSGTILYNEGIYEKLYSQIKNAKECIYIASPFLKETQVNNVKIKLLEATRKNSNLRIKILYGIKDTRESGKLINPVQLNKSRYYINELKNILGYKLLVQETNTHIKLIIFDDDSFILGSANVLSFSGTYNENPNMHSEVAIFSLDKELLKELKNKYFNW